MLDASYFFFFSSCLFFFFFDLSSGAPRHILWLRPFVSGSVMVQLSVPAAQNPEKVLPNYQPLQSFAYSLFQMCLWASYLHLQEPSKMQIRDKCLAKDAFFYLNFPVKVYQLRILENSINSDLFSTSLILTISYHLGALQLFSLGILSSVSYKSFSNVGVISFLSSLKRNFAAK